MTGLTDLAAGDSSAAGAAQADSSATGPAQAGDGSATGAAQAGDGSAAGAAQAGDGSAAGAAGAVMAGGAAAAPGDGLPRADVLIFRLVNARVVLRPSGTEPKIKCYIEIIEPLAGRPLLGRPLDRRQAPGPDQVRAGGRAGQLLTASWMAARTGSM